MKQHFAKNASNTWLKRAGEAKTLHSAISIEQLQKKRIMCLCITYFTYDMQHPVCTYLVWAKQANRHIVMSFR